MKKLLALVLIICSATSLATAQKQKSKKETPKQNPILVIKSSDAGKTFTVKRNKTFSVFFEKECIGCRGVWKLISNNKGIVKAVKDFNANPSCTNCTGGNQDHTFEFKATKAGKTQLAFEYMDEHFMVDIIVK